MRRILVIDDEQAVRESFVYALRDEAYSVVTAASGEEGLVQAQSVRPDLIFLDLKMPGMDGVTTLYKLHECCFEIPVYIATAFSREFMSALAKAAADGLPFQVVDKPLEDEQIRLIVRTVFGAPAVS